jgi:hypothetical protein
MPKIVILGSLKLGNYEVTFPVKESDYDQNHEKAYDRSWKKLRPKIDKANAIICLFSDSDVGKHTKECVKYARDKGKQITFISIDENPFKTIKGLNE